MVTDEERRRVAAALRKEALRLGPCMDAHEFANYGADLIDADNRMRWDETMTRLADLIEPSCDRAALLKIAGELEEWKVFSCSAEISYSRAIALRIRVACGEVADGQTENAETT